MIQTEITCLTKRAPERESISRGMNAREEAGAIACGMLDEKATALTPVEPDGKWMHHTNTIVLWNWKSACKNPTFNITPNNIWVEW